MELRRSAFSRQAMLDSQGLVVRKESIELNGTGIVSICLSVGLSVCLPGCLSVYIYIHISI